MYTCTHAYYHFFLPCAWSRHCHCTGSLLHACVPPIRCLSSLIFSRLFSVCEPKTVSDIHTKKINNTKQKIKTVKKRLEEQKRKGNGSDTCAIDITRGTPTLFRIQFRRYHNHLGGFFRWRGGPPACLVLASGRCHGNNTLICGVGARSFFWKQLPGGSPRARVLVFFHVCVQGKQISCGKGKKASMKYSARARHHVQEDFCVYATQVVPNWLDWPCFASKWNLTWFGGELVKGREHGHSDVKAASSGLCSAMKLSTGFPCGTWGEKYTILAGPSPQAECVRRDHGGWWGGCVVHVWRSRPVRRGQWHAVCDHCQVRTVKVKNIPRTSPRLK